MVAYLKIENPGVAPPEAFTLLGASTRRGDVSSATIGKFGSGNKHGIAVLLRNKLSPVVFGGNLKMEFGTRTQAVDAHNFDRVVVKFGGKDQKSVNRSSTEDLGFVLEYGATDWLSVDLALREFVSNSIDRAIEEGEAVFLQKWLVEHGMGAEYVSIEDIEDLKIQAKDALHEYRKTATDWRSVVIELVNESQVRAKAGYTRVFVPVNEDVLNFYNNLGKWFLHFSEPENLNVTILPKANRNINSDRQSAVIYRRGVRVREFESSDTPSLFDYNLENLELDESRKVDDWRVQYSAGVALSMGNEQTIGRLWQSFLDETPYWEHSFGEYSITSGLYAAIQKKVWSDAFDKVIGEKSVVSTVGGGDRAKHKGYKVVNVPESYVKAAEMANVPTPAKVLSLDDLSGREVMGATVDAIVAVDFAWNLVVKHHLVNGKQKPDVKTFRKIMDVGSQNLGFYRDNTVFINQDIAGSNIMEGQNLGFYHGETLFDVENETTGIHWVSLSHQLLVTALEEVAHHVTGSTDNSRDFQDFFMNLIVHMAKEKIEF